MTIKKNIQCKVTPKTTDTGPRWLLLNLKNLGLESLHNLDVRLNSLDNSRLCVRNAGGFIKHLKPREEQKLPFRVTVYDNALVYATVDGWKDGMKFFWESTRILVKVVKKDVKIISLFTPAKPFVPMGEPIECEVTVKRNADCEGLSLKFCSETQSRRVKALSEMKIQLDVEEKKKFTLELPSEEQGLHTIHAYLYDGVKMFSHQIDHVYVR